MKIYIALGTYQDYADILCVKKSLEEVEQFLKKHFKIVHKTNNYKYYVENEKHIDNWYVDIESFEV